jgi:hypothetical protein
MRKRIALEYADHLALRPRRGGAAGNPEELAGEFAAELAADDARRVARNTFAALALAALALVAGQLTIRRGRRISGVQRRPIDGARGADDPDDPDRAPDRAGGRLACRTARASAAPKPAAARRRRP